MHQEPFGDPHTKYMIPYNISNTSQTHVQGRGIFQPFQPSAVTISNRRAADSTWLASDTESTEMTQILLRSADVLAADLWPEGGSNDLSDKGCRSSNMSRILNQNILETLQICYCCSVAVTMETASLAFYWTGPLWAEGGSSTEGDLERPQRVYERTGWRWSGGTAEPQQREKRGIFIFI